MIKIHLGLLAKQPVDLEGTEPAELLGVQPSSALTILSPLTYRLTARSVSNGALVEGEISYRIGGSCGRCLEEVEQPLRNAHLCLFYDNLPEEELDITDDVREEALLLLPMNLLCSPDCRGLCPQCGANLNQETCSCTSEPDQDSPWSALDQLQL